MRRLTAPVLLAIAPLAVFACSDGESPKAAAATTEIGPEDYVKGDEGKADSSALATVLDFEFDGELVTDRIRTEEAGNLASIVARYPAVRAALLERQRAFAQPPGLVADGRDMGTVVFPAAELKIFLTASPEERARRRYNQLKDKGLSVSLADLSRDIAERDHRDASRALAPLVAAPDAVSVDSTGVSPEQIVAQVLALARQRC